VKEKKYDALRAYLKRERKANLQRHLRQPGFWIIVAATLAGVAANIVISSRWHLIWIVFLPFIGRLPVVQRLFNLPADKDAAAQGGQRELYQRLTNEGWLDSSLGHEVAAELDRCAANTERVRAFFEPDSARSVPSPEECRQVQAAVRAEMDAMFALLQPSLVSQTTPPAKTVAEVFAIGDNLDQFVSAIDSYQSAKIHIRESHLLLEALREVKVRAGQDQRT